MTNWENDEWRETHEAHYWRTKEIMAGDPEFNQTQAAMMAAGFASRVSMPGQETEVMIEAGGIE